MFFPYHSYITCLLFSTGTTLVCVFHECPMFKLHEMDMDKKVKRKTNFVSGCLEDKLSLNRPLFFFFFCLPFRLFLPCPSIISYALFNYIYPLFTDYFCLSSVTQSIFFFFFRSFINYTEYCQIIV